MPNRPARIGTARRVPRVGRRRGVTFVHSHREREVVDLPRESAVAAPLRPLPFRLLISGIHTSILMSESELG